MIYLVLNLKFYLLFNNLGYIWDLSGNKKINKKIGHICMIDDEFFFK